MEQFTLLEFGVVGADEGCELHVVGDHPALGCWSPAQSVPLHMSGTMEGLPFWKTRTPISLPSGTSIQYKYILMKDGLLHRWEAFDANRECSAIQGPSMSLIEDELDKLPMRVIRLAGSSRATSVSSACTVGGLSSDSYTSLSERGEPSRCLRRLAPRQARVGAAPVTPPTPRCARVRHSTEGAVVVVTFILPLTIEREADGGWHIAWNPDAVTGARPSPLAARLRQLAGCA